MSPRGRLHEGRWEGIGRRLHKEMEGVGWPRMSPIKYWQVVQVGGILCGLICHTLTKLGGSLV